MTNLHMYIDIHTHTLKDDYGHPALVNIEIPSAPSGDRKENIRFSAGIHPWLLRTASAEEIGKRLRQLQKAAEKGFIDAVGECGLDRATKSSFELQMEIFLRQAELAERYSLPLLIHCVRACPELISAAKKISPTSPWLVHGFSGAAGELEQLLKHDCFRVSYGSALLKKNAKTAESLKAIPLERVFFETDDSDTDISEVYSAAARILDASLSDLRKTVFDNWRNLWS